MEGVMGKEDIKIRIKKILLNEKVRKAIIAGEKIEYTVNTSKEDIYVTITGEISEHVLCINANILTNDVVHYIYYSAHLDDFGEILRECEFREFTQTASYAREKNNLLPEESFIRIFSDNCYDAFLDNRIVAKKQEYYLDGNNWRLDLSEDAYIKYDNETNLFIFKDLRLESISQSHTIKGIIGLVIGYYQHQKGKIKRENECSSLFLLKNIRDLLNIEMSNIEIAKIINDALISFSEREATILVPDEAELKEKLSILPDVKRLYDHGMTEFNKYPTAVVEAVIAEYNLELEKVRK